MVSLSLPGESTVMGSTSCVITCHDLSCFSLENFLLYTAYRDPQYSQRPSFDDLFELLNRTDSDVLSWSEDDKAQSSPQASQIGAPISAGANLYQDLQKTYKVTLV